MTNTAKLVPLSRSMDIPFNKLVLSQANVRQVSAGVSVEDLAEDIARRGLLQSLNIRPLLDDSGAETGDYHVPAGGRRFRALEILVKAKRLPKAALIPCIIGDEAAGTSAEDDSLAENVHRVALHPLDQYRAFLALRRQSLSEEDIAARYFVSVSVVKQRLRLASVSPRLQDLYAADTMTLDQLMAFSVTADHSRQEDVWELISGLAGWQKGAIEIRRLLTSTTVPATDRRAVFVGVEAYEAAGGAVLRDLFSADNGGWLQDSLLLDRMVDEKLAGLAYELSAEGWKWIEVLPSLPFDHMHGLRKIEPLLAQMPEDDRVRLAAAKTEYAALNADYNTWEQLPHDVDQRMGELESMIEALGGTGAAAFDPADVAKAGVVLTLDRNGKAEIHRGYVRPQDEPAPEADAVVHGDDVEAEGTAGGPVTQRNQTAVVTLASVEPAAGPAQDDDEEILRPLPEKLILELTAFRTVALRDAVARNPRVAMTLLLHKLVGDTFQHRFGGSCLQVFVSPPQMHNIAPKGLNETTPALSMSRRRELWAEVIPADEQALWEWLELESDEVRAELLAFCVSFGVNTIVERPNPFGAGPTQHTVDCRLKQATRVAQATDLDLVAIGWRPTADTYLNRVPRPRILEAVREGCGERAAQLIDHLKKADMVVEAERLLADAGWLPEVLRGPEVVALQPEAEPEALPAFLTEGTAAAKANGLNAQIAAE